LFLFGCCLGGKGGIGFGYFLGPAKSFPVFILGLAGWLILFGGWFLALISVSPLFSLYLAGLLARPFYLP